MNLLFIASGYLPYTFSENLCNAKLVYAMQSIGWHVDVISKHNESNTYSTEWVEPWLPLKPYAREIRYPLGSKVGRMCDIVASSCCLKMFPVEGIRWVRRAVSLALELCKKNHYDAVLTRAPDDTAHYVGAILKRQTGIRWIANWNDPAAPIWPRPYTNDLSGIKHKLLMHYTGTCLKEADVNTFPSEYLLDHFKAHFPVLNNKDCRVIPHIALPEEIFPHTEYKRHEKLMLCHSGNLSVERDPENLFRAMRELVDEGCNLMQLDIMGTINDYTQTLIGKYRLEEYVKFLGGFPYLTAVEKMAEYDVLVLVEAILDKGIFFPSKLTDYVQSGKPILAVSPADGFVHDLLSKYGGGIHTDNTDHRQIKAALEKLYRCWQNNTLVEKNSPKHIYEYFSADAVINAYTELLNQ